MKMIKFIFSVLVYLSLVSSLVLAQQSHPAGEVQPGIFGANFPANDYTFRRKVYWQYDNDVNAAFLDADSGSVGNRNAYIIFDSMTGNFLITSKSTGGMNWGRMSISSGSDIATVDITNSNFIVDGLDNTFYVDATNNRIGIGTSNPGTYKLNIAGGSLYVGGNIVLSGTVDGYDISTYGQYFIDSVGSSGQVWKSDGSGRGVWGTDNVNDADSSATNEIQNIIANKGLQRDGSNNFGIINCANGQIVKYDALGRWVCASDATDGGGAPTDATYVVMSLDPTLINERILTAGPGISITDGGAGNPVVITNIGDLSNTNEIQNIIANKGLQRDASNNFGIINCANGEIVKYDALGRWVCASDATDGGGYWVQSGTNLYPNGLGWRVGIGTSGPAVKFEVSDSITPTIRISNSDPGIAPLENIGTIEFWGNGGKNTVTSKISVDSPANWVGVVEAPSQMSFYTTDIGSTTPEERMVIRYDGNVGIKSANPSYNLDVTGTIRATSDVISDDDVIFYGELMPDGVNCANGQILQKTGADNWDCVNMPSGGIGCADCDTRFVNTAGDTMTGSLSMNGDLTVSGGDISIGTSGIHLFGDGIRVSEGDNGYFYDSGLVAIGNSAGTQEVQLRGSNVKISNTLEFTKNMDQILFTAGTDDWWIMSKEVDNKAFAVYSPPGDGGTEDGFRFSVEEDGDTTVTGSMKIGSGGTYSNLAHEDGAMIMYGGVCAAADRGKMFIAQNTHTGNDAFCVCLYYKGSYSMQCITGTSL